MSTEKYYLRGNVQVEPLINSWYAWSFLVSPVTFSLVSKNLHLRVLDSYLRAPEQHQKAVRDRALRGGLFVDHQGTIEDIQNLVARTKEELSDLLSLAEDINSTSLGLQVSEGESLRGLYQSLPASLKGRLELAYDLFNKPRMRFIENIFYFSSLYKPQLQSISLSLLESDTRPFVMSSPRLENSNNLMVHMPFSDTRWDDFFRLRFSPRPLAEIKSMINWQALNPEKQELFLTLLTKDAPQKIYQKPAAEEIRVRYFGHATVLIETTDVCVLTDPIISYDINSDDQRFSFKNLPEKIDYVVLTHNHQDHVMLETLLQLRHRIGTIVVGKNIIGELADPSLKLMLQTIGFQNIKEIDELENLEICGGSITGIPFLGEHGDLNVMSKLAIHLRLRDTSFMFAADSDNISPELYSHVHQRVGNIDYIFIGMECAGAPLSWLYGPLFAKPLSRKYDQDRRLNGSNSERAFKIVQQFNPKTVYVYAMGSEPWLTFISSIELNEDSEPFIQSENFLTRCHEIGIEAERLYGMKELVISTECAFG